MTAVLKTEKLTRKLEGEIPVTLVDNIDLNINKGEFIAITGPSGSGKSSLLYLLGLLDKPTSGEIFLNGEATKNYNQKKLADIRLRELGFVFQFHFLLPEFTALENVMLPLQRQGVLNNNEIITRAKKLLSDLGLKEHIDKKPCQMSGGQCQRVAIARALANNPLLILADEPTGNLDTASSKNVQSILKDLAHNHGKTIIVVTHDTEFAKTTDRQINLIDGKISI